MIRLLSCLVVVLLSAGGCAHVNESSGTASVSQIEARMASILSASSLQLRALDDNHFTGAGQNRTGEFTLEVKREGNQLSFQGAYLPPARGNITGTTSWTRKSNAFFGVKESTRTSFSTQ